MKKILMLLVLLVFCCIPAWAADHDNLEEDLPIHVEDAYPIGFQGREFQGVFRYEETNDGESRFRLEPRVEYGFAPNWQIAVSSPFLLGNADRQGSGDVRLKVLHNFNTETLDMPAISISGEAIMPTGKESAGLDTQLKLLVTRSVSKTGLDRVHFNLAWEHNAANAQDERGDRYIAVLGYSRRVGPQTLFLADFVREQGRKKGEHANIVEFGVRHQVHPRTVLSLGVGAGIGQESPRFRVTTGFQTSF